MNEETQELLSQLASKLGTTAEYLWGVLLKQAPIDGFLHIGFFLLATIAGVALWKLHKHFMVERGERHKESIYDSSEPAAAIFMFLAGIIWAVLFIIATVGLGHAVTAFTNPEYWALTEILSASK